MSNLTILQNQVHPLNHFIWKWDLKHLNQTTEENLCIGNLKKLIFSGVHQSLPSDKAIFKQHILSFV